MRRTTWSAFIVLFLGLLRPGSLAACSSLGYFQPRPIQCAQSVALSIAVDRAALFPGDRERADAFERRLRAEAIQKLGENRIALDPEGHDLHFEILQTPDGGVLIAVYSRGSESADLVLDAEEVENQPSVATENISAGAWRTPNLLAQVAQDLFARSIANNWQSDCDPPRTLSANGNYAFELPPRHPEARERYLSSLAEGAGLEPSDPRPVGSLLALSDDGAEEERLSSFRLADETLPERFLVSDDGLFVVAFDLRESRSGGQKGNTLIYRADGGLIARLALDDLLTPDDLEEIRRNWWVSSCGSGHNPLSASLDDDRDLLILTLGDREVPHEIAIELKSGRLLTARRDFLPHMRVTIGGYLAAGGLQPAWQPPVCIGPIDAGAANRAFAAQDLFSETSGSLFGYAVERPIPAYTEIAKRARLQGTVEVEVVVSETGQVSCARVSRLPMGLGRAAEAAALKWRFLPFVADGKPVRAIGRFSFRFGWVDPPGER
jgi:TonB family protein